MTRSPYILLMLAAVMLTILPSCTNDGDIGYLYGEWALSSYTIDGADAEVDCSQYYWQFQSDIICVVKTLPHNDYLYSFGTWQVSDDVLTLDFTHVSDDEAPESSAYNPPPELGIPSRAKIPLDIIKMTSKQLILKYYSQAGVTNTYTLNKLK